jgi:hypothetical protein
MARKDSSVSPYLLRPLRTLTQVLGGRSSEAESRSCRIEDRQTCDGQDERAKAAVDASDGRRSAERPSARLQP